MDMSSPVSWVFKPESTAPSASISAQHAFAASGSLTKSLGMPGHLQSPSTSQTYASPLTPRSTNTQQLSPYKASSASPHRSSGLTRSQSATQSQDLLLPLMPSTEDSKLHATVSGLRYALQETQLQLSHSQHQARRQGSLAQCCMLHIRSCDHADPTFLAAAEHVLSASMPALQLMQSSRLHTRLHCPGIVCRSSSLPCIPWQAQTACIVQQLFMQQLRTACTVQQLFMQQTQTQGLPETEDCQLLVQVDALQQQCIAATAQSTQLQHHLSDTQADKALLGAKLHDGSLDIVKGQLIQQLQQQLAESSAAAEAATGVSQQAAAEVQKLQEQLALQQQAQANERERLSMEAAQSRLLCKARARQVSALEGQYKAQVSCCQCSVNWIKIVLLHEQKLLHVKAEPQSQWVLQSQQSQF